jgi:hypothetical protein
LLLEFRSLNRAFGWIPCGILKQESSSAGFAVEVSLCEVSTIDAKGRPRFSGLSSRMLALNRFHCTGYGKEDKWVRKPISPRDVLELMSS